MAESWAFERRVYVEDPRLDGSYLRVTWHPESAQFVVSHWQGEVCIAASRVPVAAAPQLIGLLANGLGQAANVPLAAQPRRSA